MGDLEMTRTILTAGSGPPVQVHARTVHGHTALSAAALFGHPDVVELLMSCGLDVNSKNVEGLILVDEVLDDIDYSLVGDGKDSDDSTNTAGKDGVGGKNDDEHASLESSMASVAHGGSDPLLLEKAAILLLRGGAELSMSNCFAFHEKFCGAWADVTDEELQDYIEEACERAEEAELKKTRQQEERARTPALVVRRLNGDAATMAEESRPSLFKTRTPAAKATPGTSGAVAGGGSAVSDNGNRSDSKTVPEIGEDGDEMSPTGFTQLMSKGSPGLLRKSPRVSPPGRKSGRSRAGRVRQRRYVHSPKVNANLGSGSVISPSKPKSPDRTKDTLTPKKETVTTPGKSRVIQDISSFIVEGAGDEPPPLPPRNSKKREAASQSLTQTRSDDSLEVSWSKQLAQTNKAVRPKSQDSVLGADPLEESHPPRVKLPVIGKK